MGFGSRLDDELEDGSGGGNTAKDNQSFGEGYSICIHRGTAGGGERAAWNTSDMIIFAVGFTAKESFV